MMGFLSVEELTPPVRTEVKLLRWEAHGVSLCFFAAANEMRGTQTVGRSRVRGSIPNKKAPESQAVRWVRLSCRLTARVATHPKAPKANYRGSFTAGWSWGGAVAAPARTPCYFCYSCRRSSFSRGSVAVVAKVAAPCGAEIEPTRNSFPLHRAVQD